LEFSNASLAFPELFYIAISRRYKKLQSVRHHGGKTGQGLSKMPCSRRKTGLAQTTAAG